MIITRNQFIRGFRAVRKHLDGARSVREAAEAAGWRELEVGDEAICDELMRQLTERCDDEDRPVGNSKSLIEYALWDAEGVEDTGDGVFDFRQPEEVWRFWEEGKTGPFKKAITLVVTPDAEAFSAYVAGPSRAPESRNPEEADK